VRSPWRLLTARGRTLAVAGLVVVVVSMFTGQRDVMRIGLLLVALPAVALVLVTRARLRMSAERVVEPAQVPLGTPVQARIVLGHDSLLPAALLELEDRVPPELGPQPRFLVDRTASHWQRVVEYPLLGRVRGRYHTGPLTVRTTDPFGLVRLDRQFTATSEVVITPQVVDLGSQSAGGGGGNTGDARPRRIGVVGADDVLVREYRQGDDVRRIHWRSTARAGDLMVRREEQAFDPSATLVLDSRLAAHAGRGVNSSLEWAVSAAASIGLHFLADGFAVEVYDADGPLHLGGASSQHSSVSSDALLRRLTDLRASDTRSLRYVLNVAAAERPGQLVVAVLGRLDPEEAQALLRLRRHRAPGLAVLLDVDTFEDGGAARRAGPSAPLAGDLTTLQHAVSLLTDARWRVVVVPRGTGVAQAWAELDRQGVGV
jgi:uncharacterized protein (DUF58 family)